MATEKFDKLNLSLKQKRLSAASNCEFKPVTKNKKLTENPITN